MAGKWSWFWRHEQNNNTSGLPPHWFSRRGSILGFAMHLLFIIDPIEELAAYKDTSVSMMRACLARGHRVRRSEEHTSELQSRGHLVCRLLLEKNKNDIQTSNHFILD